MNVLILSAGTRCKTVEYFQRAAGTGRVITTDCSPLAPALYLADGYHVVPRIDDPGYLNVILDICRQDRIDLCLSLIDPELTLLAQNVDRFAQIGTTVMISPFDAVQRAFDKWEMFRFCQANGIPAPRTWIEPDELRADLGVGLASFPLYAKPRTGSASKDNYRIESAEDLEAVYTKHPGMMVQELMTDDPLDVDVYVDMISGEVVSLFAKKKLRMREGTADKAVSVRDPVLESFIVDFCAIAGFRGALDIDVFRTEQGYSLLEVNPRFGGVYPHAHECGVDFPSYALRNARGLANDADIGTYESGWVMMTYEEVIAVPERLDLHQNAESR
ncbi:ATP-grasp domain-containing protein [Ancrocorticia sp.]|uniref:ATP-grasp domain-containing protein n=2 Tax=Ancrocorticia sp. TaxID=2593684 RepID=UPI003F913FA8